MKFISFLSILTMTVACAATPKANTNKNKTAKAWTFTRGELTQPRGGTSTGTPVTFDTKIPNSWNRLQEKGLSTFEKDRRAIYALEGEFKTSFEFLETFNIDPSKKLDRPYLSWATEMVNVIEDRNDFISLQHIMVMYYKQKGSNKVIGPMVMKHWRQDWTWQPSSQLSYQGLKTWKTEPLKTSTSQGHWLWEVYQVDDSPRYSGLGQWEHFASASTFNTKRMNRPLPRREFSVRKDYKILTGHESLVVTPKAWYHEQKSFKQIGLSPRSGFLGRELGHNSYKRITQFDFSEGHKYWNKTKDYWAEVRSVWREIQNKNPSFTLKGKVNGKALYEYHFEQAESDIINKKPSERRKLIYQTITSFITNP